MRLVARRGEEMIPVDVEWTGSQYRVLVGEREMLIDLIRANGMLRSLRLSDGRQFLLTHQREGERHTVSFGGREVQFELLDPLAIRRGSSDQVARSGAAQVTALMPGRVVRIFVEVGAEVKQGDGLLILEAMKMENEVTAPRSGKVAVLHVKPGQTVESGAPLVEIEGS